MNYSTPKILKLIEASKNKTLPITNTIRKEQRTMKYSGICINLPTHSANFTYA